MSGNRSSEENDVIHRWQNRQSVRSIAGDLNLSRYKVTRIIVKYTRDRDVDAATYRKLSIYAAAQEIQSRLSQNKQP